MSSCNFIVEDLPSVEIKSGMIAKIIGLPANITAKLTQYEIGTMEGAVTIVYSNTVLDQIEGSTTSGDSIDNREMNEDEQVIHEAFEKCVQMMGDHCDVIIM
tara:strand:- start:62 stop:367 length:306 start_codon:yes stop_codon:yes gene_type:complete